MNRPELSLDTETAESLQAAYNRLFTPGTKLPEDDSYSLAQPYLQRSVPSFASDNTELLTPYPERG
jgi:hypothetical protein